MLNLYNMPLVSSLYIVSAFAYSDTSEFRPPMGPQNVYLALILQGSCQILHFKEAIFYCQVGISVQMKREVICDHLYA